MLLKSVKPLIGQCEVKSHYRHPGLLLCICTLVFLADVAITSSIQQTSNGPGLPAQSKPSAKGVSNTDSLVPSDQREKLQSGWLYVLDSNDLKRESQVLLLDPEQGRIVRTFTVGSGPEMSLSPDGRRLYVASTRFPLKEDGGRGVLEVMDTTSGAVLQTLDNPGRWVSTLPWYPSHMTLSPDGRWLYIFKIHQTQLSYSSYLVTFDTVRGQFLPEKAPLFSCVTAQLLPLSEPLRLNVISLDSDWNKIAFLRLTENGAAVAPRNQSKETFELDLPLQEEKQFVKVTEEHRKRAVAFGFLSFDNRTLTVVTGGGRLLKVDNETRKIIQTDVIDHQGRKLTSNLAGAASTTSDDWLIGRWIRYQIPPLSPDRTKLYVGVAPLSSQSFDRIAVLDSQTLKLLGMIKPRYVFYNLAMSKDGSRLYAISPDQACVIVIDASTGQEICTIYGVGQTPIQAIVAP
jgi:DNA-binding beta-propeller fold protein YncE